MPTCTPAGPATRRRADWQVIEQRTVDQVIERDLDAAVGFQYSWASCDPTRLGGEWPAFEVDLRRALRAACSDGRFVQPYRTELMIAARRPDGAPCARRNEQ